MNDLASVLEKVQQGTLQPVEAESLIKNFTNAAETPEESLKSFALRITFQDRDLDVTPFCQFRSLDEFSIVFLSYL